MNLDEAMAVQANCDAMFERRMEILTEVSKLMESAGYAETADYKALCEEGTDLGAQLILEIGKVAAVYEAMRPAAAVMEAEVLRTNNFLVTRGVS